MSEYIYTDQVLRPLVTSAIEETAISEIETLGTLPGPWPERLTILRVYVLICLEYASASDDPFSIKLPYYKAEYDQALLTAKAAQQRATSNILFMAMERS